MEQKLVSIITPVYNAEQFIEETLVSVLNQTYPHWEYLLINDCSTDKSAQIIEAYAQEDPRIRLITLEENSGAAVARNKGLSLAKGSYIAFIDSDDIWHPEKLEKQLNFMQAHQYVFTYTNLALISEEGELIKDKMDLPLQLSYSDLLKNTAIACSSVVIDIEKIGPFQMPLVRKGQDTATWLMLMRERHIQAYGMAEVLNYYRQVKNSISSNKIQALKRTWNTYYRLEKLALPKALYYFTHYVLNAIKRRILK